MLDAFFSGKNHWVFAFFAFVLASPASGAQETPGNAHLSGHVYYQDGEGAPGAKVEIWGMWAGGQMLPEPVHTDVHGVWTMAYPAYGDAWVTASNVSEGYPNAIISLYGRKGYASYRFVRLKAEAVLNDIDLRFGAPDATLHCVVKDGRTGQNLKDARVIEWPNNSQTMMSRGLDSDGTFSFVLPKHPVTLTISEQDFVPWKYQDPRTGKYQLSARPGAHVPVTAVLQPRHP